MIHLGYRVMCTVFPFYFSVYTTGFQKRTLYCMHWRIFPCELAVDLGSVLFSITSIFISSLCYVAVLLSSFGMFIEIREHSSLQSIYLFAFIQIIPIKLKGGDKAKYPVSCMLVRIKCSLSVAGCNAICLILWICGGAIFEGFKPLQKNIFVDFITQILWHCRRHTIVSF